MKTYTYLIKAIALGSVAALAMSACGDNDESAAGNAGEVTLQYAFFAPASTFPAVQMQEWADQMEERTDGAVTVETFPGATLLDSGDIYPGVASEIVEVGLDGPSYDPNQFPMSSAAALPLGFDNAEQASANFLELLLEEEPEEFAEFQIVTAFTAEPAYIQTAEPVRTLDDLKGLTLRSPGGSHNDTVEALGAVPIGMPPPEIAENLGTGVLDGIVGSREQLMDFELAEFLPYLTEVPLGPSASFVAVMNQSVFDGLDSDIQDEILALREEMSVFAAQYQDSHALESIDWAQENYDLEVIQLEDSEKAEWQDILDGNVDQWIDDHQGADFDPQAVVDRLRDSSS
jgi:TRAP-type C4-dicarboxylate transport system substrate-binding protein